MVFRADFVLHCSILENTSKLQDKWKRSVKRGLIKGKLLEKASMQTCGEQESLPCKTMFGLSVLGFQNDRTLGQEKPNFYNFIQLKNLENLRISQVVFWVHFGQHRTGKMSWAFKTFSTTYSLLDVLANASPQLQIQWHTIISQALPENKDAWNPSQFCGQLLFINKFSFLLTTYLLKFHIPPILCFQWLLAVQVC